MANILRTLGWLVVVEDSVLCEHCPVIVKLVCDIVQQALEESRSKFIIVRTLATSQLFRSEAIEQFAYTEVAEEFASKSPNLPSSFFNFS